MTEEARAEGAPRRRRSCALAALGAGLLLALVLRLAVLPAIPRLLEHRDDERPADAIVVFGGDGGERVTHAVSLWRKGLSRSGLLVLAGGPVYHRTTFASLMAGHAQELGVPREKLVVEDVSRTTGEDAREAVRVLEERGLRSAVLVTSAWHSARARRRFLDAAGGRIEAISCPAPAPELPCSWWSDPVAARAITTEVLKWLWPGPG